VSGNCSSFSSCTTQKALGEVIVRTYVYTVQVQSAESEDALAVSQLEMSQLPLQLDGAGDDEEEEAVGGGEETGVDTSDQPQQVRVGTHKF
jgi:hypothetical protein